MCLLCLLAYAEHMTQASPSHTTLFFFSRFGSIVNFWEEARGRVRR
jgi:hypothetical protein